ncbi:hypothetical protein NDU88_006114 [Pleurodeles waltl]|uniref:Uncharacterized protein n=1 Tax=Pleurodeles waltl TaxID=8319 RepID=A0AAV7N0C6_PLEWA|nr:hypothetical protein NDU88_006114 [Pleurodeles waltl]
MVESWSSEPLSNDSDSGSELSAEECLAVTPRIADNLFCIDVLVPRDCLTVESTYYSSNKSKGSPLAHGRSDQIRLSDLIGCPIQRNGAADVSVSGDMSADTRCHPHLILSVKSGRMETLFSIRPGWGSDRMGSDESGQAVRSHPIPHREQRGSDISLSAHSAETELSSAGSAGISGSIHAEQRTVRNVFVCH